MSLTGSFALFPSHFIVSFRHPVSTPKHPHMRKHNPYCKSARAACMTSGKKGRLAGSGTRHCRMSCWNGGRYPWAVEGKVKRPLF